MVLLWAVTNGNWLDGPLLPHKPLTKGPFFSTGPFFPDRFYPDRFYLDRSYPDRSYRHPKNRHFHVPQPTFLFPPETPLRLSRNMLHGWKTIQCLPNPSQHVRCTYLSSIVSELRCLSQCVSPKIAIFTTFFVFPGGAPGTITLNVVWIKREFDAYKLSRSMYPSIVNSFPVIRTASAKNCRFHVPQRTFLFPLETPLRISRNMLHGRKDNFNLVLAKPLAA